MMKNHIQEDPNKIEKKDEYSNYVYQNGCHQYEGVSHASKYIYFRYVHSYSESLTNWNFVLGCCVKCRKITTAE